MNQKRFVNIVVIIGVVIVVSVVVYFITNQQLFLLTPSPTPTPTPEPMTQLPPTDASGRCLVLPLSERINSSDLIIIATFNDYFNKPKIMNAFLNFTDIEVMKGILDNKENITVMGGGGTLTPYFEKEKRYILFLKDFNEDGINDLDCMPTVKDYKIRKNDEGQEIVGCLRDFNKCNKVEILCSDTEQDIPEPIVRDAEGNIIPQPPQPEKKCYSEGYALLKDILKQIQNQD